MFLGFWNGSSSEGEWEDGGLWLIRIGGEGWVLWEFFQGSPCFEPWLLIGIALFGVSGGVSGSGGFWVEVELCLI